MPAITELVTAAGNKGLVHAYRGHVPLLHSRPCGLGLHPYTQLTQPLVQIAAGGMPLRQHHLAARVQK